MNVVLPGARPGEQPKGEFTTEIMKTTFYARIVFGASAVLFGVIALMWHDADTWQNLSEIWRLPFGTVIGGCLMIVQIAGGIGMQYPRTARLASIALGIVYLLFSLACIPGIAAAPAAYERYGSFFEPVLLTLRRDLRHFPGTIHPGSFEVAQARNAI
jgi:hypothetical protein